MDGYAVRAADTARRAADRRPVRRRAPRDARASARARRSRSRRAASSRRAPMRSSRSSASSCGRPRSRSPTPSPSEDNIRSRGGDVRAGDERARGRGRPHRRARRRARRLRDRERSPAHRAPRVAIVVTGSELRPPGEPARAGSDLRVERVMLARCARGGGRRRRATGGGGGHGERLCEQALARALEADVVVTSGGVSVGPHDLVRRGRGAARRRGGVLGRRDAAGQAARVRRPRRDARLRAAREPASRRSSAACSSSRPALRALQGDPDPAPPFPAGSARPAR